MQNYPEKSLVLLTHGLLMPASVMTLLERGLRKAGFATRGIGYHSRTRQWSEGVEILRDAVLHSGAERVHFIGHSMGGLLVTALLNETPDLAVGRVVTIGTPFNGSLVARNMRRSAFGRRLLGNADSLLASGLSPEWANTIPLHGIAGSSGNGLPRLLFARDLDRPHDGVVSASECRVEGMSSFDVFDCNHTMLLANRQVADRIVALLRDGNGDAETNQRSA